MPEGRVQHVKQVAILMAIAVVGLNLAFYLLSDWYYRGRNATEIEIIAAIASVRIAFAVFTVLVGVVSVIAAFAPRTVGHVIAVVMGVVSLLAAFAAFARGMTAVLPFTLIIIGGLLPTLAYYSMKTSRAAWAFLTSLCGVYATVLLFGAPKVRYLLDIGLWTALIVPGLLFVATTALVIARADYRDAV